MLRGFDVSHHNGAIDWSALKAKHGISFGACKATEGTDFQDSEFARNWTRLKTAGLVRKAYHFGRPARPVLASADHFVDFVGPLLPTDILVLDLETGDGLSQALVNKWAKAWQGRVTQRTGRIPEVYMGSAYLSNNTGDGFNQRFSALWYPRYPNVFADRAVWPTSYTPPIPVGSSSWTSCNWGRRPDFWQFSASFPTSEGKLDANVYNGTLANLHALAAQGVDVPLTDDDAAKVANAVWKLGLANLIQSTPDKPVKSGAGAMLSYVHKRTFEALQILSDPAEMAAAIAAKLPPDQPASQADIEAGIRAVLGSLDEPTSP